MSLPVPYGGGPAKRALKSTERSGLIAQAEAISGGRLASIYEGIAYTDAARRINRGHDLFALTVVRSAQAHRAIQNVRDDDLRELFEAGLGQVFGASLMRVTRYIGGD